MTKKTKAVEQDDAPQATVTTPTDATVANPLPLQDDLTPPAPPEAQVRKKTNFDRVLEKVEEIEVMAGHGHKELRDTIRARCAEIRDILT